MGSKRPLSGSRGNQRHLGMLWTPWCPLSGASRNQDIPRAPGLYRIRRVDIPGLDYVGQTGVLRQRMGNLNNVYGDVMPYNAPHTAGPGFWAFFCSRLDSSCHSLREGETPPE